MAMSTTKIIVISGSVLLLLIIIGAVVFTSMGDSGDAPNTYNPPPPPDTTGNTGNTGPVEPVLKTYKCETRKVCEGRTGYANWVKTGSQKKCIVTNISQLACLSDCLGTCSAWE